MPPTHAEVKAAASRLLIEGDSREANPDLFDEQVTADMRMVARTALELVSENERLQAAGLALMGYLHHGWCDSMHSIDKPDCACGLKAKAAVFLAAPPPAGPERREDGAP